MSGTETEKIRAEAELRWPVTVAISWPSPSTRACRACSRRTIRYGVIGVCLLLLIPVVVVNPRRLVKEAPWARRLAMTAAAVLLVANLVAFVELMFRC